VAVGAHELIKPVTSAVVILFYVVPFKMNMTKHS